MAFHTDHWKKSKHNSFSLCGSVVQATLDFVKLFPRAGLLLLPLAFAAASMLPPPHPLFSTRKWQHGIERFFFCLTLETPSASVCSLLFPWRLIQPFESDRTFPGFFNFWYWPCIEILSSCTWKEHIIISKVAMFGSPLFWNEVSKRPAVGQTSNHYYVQQSDSGFLL